MDRRERPIVSMGKVRRAAYFGLVTLALVLLSCPVRADELWTAGPRLGLLEYDPAASPDPRPARASSQP